MFRSTSLGFSKYIVSDSTNLSAKKWEDTNMYKTSYLKQSEKNVTFFIFNKFSHWQCKIQQNNSYKLNLIDLTV